MVEPGEAIGAHQPDEVDAPMPGTQKRQRACREGARQLGLEGRHLDTGVLLDGFAARKAFTERRQRPRRFQRVARRHHPPDGIEAETLQRNLADQPVRRVRWVERAAEQADALAWHRQGWARRDRAETDGS